MAAADFASAGTSAAGLPHVTALFNLVAILAILVITTVLVIGIKESANLNTAIVFIKLSVVGIFIVLGAYFLLHHPALAWANWHPFIPPSDGHGNFGLKGIATGAASIFFAYIGLTPFPQRLRKPRIRKRICRSAFLARW